MDRHTEIFITTFFPAYHRWVDAPEKYWVLREYHRHIFHVSMNWEVSHANREIEFIEMKNKVDAYIEKELKNKYFNYSCEMLAKILLMSFEASSVTVSEDGENGATVIVK